MSPAETRFARALTQARRRLLRLRLVAESFGLVPPDRWLEPFPSGFALRHLWWAGEDAGVWRFGLLSRWPNAPESRRLLGEAWPAAFGTPFSAIDAAIENWSSRAPSDPANLDFVEGLRRADRILSALRRGAGGDAAMDRAKADFAALKRRQKRTTLLFSSDRLYAFCVYQDLWRERFGPALPEEQLVAALWPRRAWFGVQSNSAERTGSTQVSARAS